MVLNLSNLDLHRERLVITMKHAARKGLGAILVLLLISLLVVASSCSSTKTPTKTTEATSEKPNKPQYAFENPAACSGCHDLLFSQWRSTMHANAFTDPFYWKEAELAGKEAGEAIRNFCHSCHSPGGTLLGKIPADAAKASEIAKAGVFCDFCHTVTSSKGIGNASYIVKTGEVKRGPYKDSYSPYHLTEYSEFHTKAEFCGMCHDVYHPINGLRIEETYTEWKNSPYAAKGIVCQDCHMTPGPGVTKPNPGVVAVGGPNRDHFWTHHTIGANVFMANYLKLPETARLALERLRSAARLTASVSRAANKASLKVTVTNVGAGHKLPTGLTEMRHMWLEVVAKDAKGTVIYSSGVLDAKRNLPEGTKIYYTVLGDKNGKPTVKVWEAEKILLDTRIPPGQSKTEEYAFEIPSGAPAPYTVTVRLLYRSAFQDVIDKLFEDKPQVPEVEMAKTVLTLN